MMQGAVREIASVLFLVYEFVGRNPRHHAAQTGTDFFNRVSGGTSARRLEARLVDLVLKHPVTGEFA